MSASDVQAAWVGARVRDERKRLGWTGRDLAEHAGVSHNTVVAIEQGRRVREGTIAKVREALGVELDSPLPDPYTEAAQQAVTAWLTAALTRDEQRKRLAYIVTAMAQYGKESISVGVGARLRRSRTPAGGGQPKIRSGSAANAIRCAATSAVRM